MTELRIRQSELQSFMRCRRRWMLEYRRGLEQARDPNQPKENLSLGSILHLCVDEFWQGRDPMKLLAKIEQDVIARVDGALSDRWVYVFKYLRPMVQAYVQWTETGITMQEKVIDSEFVMEVPWGRINGYDVVLTGKSDRVVEDLFTNTLAIVDLKKAKAFRTGKTHNFQLLTYAVMYQRLNSRPIERLYTEQVKEVLRDGKAKPPFVLRDEMYVNEEMLANQEKHLTALLWDITACVRTFETTPESSAFYPHPTGDCSWDCDFLPVCTSMDDGSDYEYIIETIYRLRPKEDTYQ